MSRRRAPIRAAVLALALALGPLATPVHAVLPDEILDDPVLESRARALSKGLRCLVCRNENIDESNADLARELRLLVRERLVAGDSDDAVMAYIVDRYGEFVLLRPPVTGSTVMLWVAGPAMLIAALGVGALYVRRRSRAQVAVALSPAEEARLREILKQ